MAEITKALNLSWECLQQTCITVEEREHMDASFMIISLLNMFLKETGDNKESPSHVVLVLFQNNFQHLNNIGMKLFMSLKSLVQSQKLTLLEMFSEESSVQDKFKSIHNSISSIQAKDKLIIFTNLNHLTYMGAPENDIFDFVHYVKNTLGEHTCVLHCTHNKQDNVVETLNNAIRHLSSYVIQVSNLKTGFCKEISGHINVSNKYKTYKKTHHFLFTSRGVNVFLPGGISTR
uniref:Elongator complex protein 6 n=1 Tax=Cacopsylla melanoneura TaxID=428564 RepID=A0A8D8ZQT6_9HEMI